RSGHAAAAGIEIDDLRARDAAQQLQRRLCAHQAALVTVGLHEDALWPRLELQAGLMHQHLFEREAGCRGGIRPASLIATQESWIIILDRENAARLASHHFPAGLH